ncbi:acyltransferase family protein [Terriglobus sp. RCC_193]|uniref:acyltransferase family protein n=1 Tax=Terriglobus sp. RCC_193 TaxID=3239218 RepID=UPI003525962F
MSIFLDVLRFSAALIVVLGHFTQYYFSQGWPDLTVYALCAVSVFFVLSGFVIAFVVKTKERRPRDYAIARISRLYSVLVPAIVLSGLVLLIGVRLDPGYMATWTGAGASLGFLAPHPLLRFAAQSLLSLLFLNSIHNHEAFPAMNSPVWSLGYEAAYYAVFGIALFSRGWKRIGLIVAWCLLMGDGIIRLLPVWLLGVGLFYLVNRMRSTKRDQNAGIACLVLLAISIVCWHWVFLWEQQPHGYWVDAVMHGKDRAQMAYLFYYWGIMTALAIYAAAALEPLLARILTPAEKAIRWCADLTFSLYLFHFPLLVAVYVLTHYNRSSVTAQAGALSATLIGCWALSYISEHRKYWWRQQVRRIADTWKHAEPSI